MSLWSIRARGGRSNLPSAAVSAFRLIRPQFLAAGFFLTVLGTAIAAHDGAFDLWRAVVFLIVAWSLQIVGATANEYADVETDRMNTNRTWFSGGSGMIVSGAVKRDTAMVLAIMVSMFALIVGLLMSVVMGVTYVVPMLVVIGMGLGLSYSIRPLRLVYRGLGELAMGMMVSVMIPVGAFLAQDGRLDSAVILAAVPLFFQLIGLMMVVQHPDYDADRRAGKRNLVVILGKDMSWRLGVFMLIIAAATAFYGALFGLPVVSAFAAGAFLVIEALYMILLEKHLGSKAVVFWSTVISCGFYILVISILAAGFVLF
jgi:1,4-dihydroxy-2-naphthoate octaprenyltransferase